MKKLRELHPLVGYSGHERNIAVSLAAVALDACIIERHITLDRDMEGPDHAASLEPAEFTSLVLGIREIEAARGLKTDSKQRPVSQGELINRENLGKSIVAARAIRAGTTLKAEDFLVRSPGQGLSPIHLPKLIGKKLSRSLREDDYLFAADLEQTNSGARQYKFKRPWGIPVRYHDVNDFLARSNPDLIEFHLSYQDLERNPEDYLHAEYDLDFVVHAPELFSGSRLMDLASQDPDYRRFSIVETQRVIDITRGLNKFFPKTVRPPIVLNVGGFSMDAPLTAEERQQRYATFTQSFAELDMDGVELIPQTMAPFPWHFGGQRYQNIFVWPEESAQLCEKLRMRMCLDISHTKLASNHFGFDFLEGIAALGPHVAHLHLGDSKGLDGEGLQIGAGDIDFQSLGEVLHRIAPSASFIPEIWQGHKNLGEGFWVALEKLEPYL